MRRALPVALCFSCATLATLAARAERLAVIDFRFLNAPPALRSPVEEILTQALQASGWELIVPRGAEAHAALSASSGCVAGPCVARRAKALRADHLLTGAVEAHGSSSYDVTLSLIDPEGGSLIAQISKRCDVCNYGDVTAAVARAATALRAAARKALRVQGWLELRTRPSDAAVHIDGAPAGRSPLRRLVGAGPHRVAAFKSRRSARQTVLVHPGETERRTLQLSATPPPEPTERSAWMGWVGWSAIAVGVITTAAGGGVWSQASSCEGACQQTHSAIGGGLVGGGAGAMGVGALLLILDRLRCRALGGHLALDATSRDLKVMLTYRH